ncbi:GKAP1 protein, partial [Pseudoatta argentina]
MATAVPSRFAVLSIEDDDYKPKKTQKNATTSKNNAKSKSDKSKPQQQQQPNKKKQNKGKKKKTNNDDQQWEQWKQKDTMAVEETFEQELHQAILLSKLAYEEQLVSVAKNEKEQEQNKKSGKKSKKATMSLEEFNSMGTSATVVPTNEPTDKTREVDTEFFERVEKETKEEITKGKEKDILKARLNKIDDDITFAQLRVEIEKRDEVIGQLRAEVHMLKEELTQVKERNKKLYQILSHGESKYHIFYASNACICKLLLFVIIFLLLVKDKASVLAEVAKLQEIRDELTSEVASLHAQLEQERSKTRTSSVDVKTSKQTVRTRYIVSIFL